MSLLETVQRNIAPNAQTLWERGEADIRQVEIDPKRYESVPFFDLSIQRYQSIYDQPLLDELGREIGRTYTDSYITSDGIDRATRLHLPSGDHRNHNFDFIIQFTTAWFTSIDGHNDNSAQILARAIGVPVIEIGAEHSTRVWPFPFEGLRLAKTIQNSRKISLAKSAQSSQLITADLCERYSLPKAIVKIGESRGAMIAPGEHPYADLYGNSIVYTDTTAPCVPDQMFEHKSDIARLGQWPGSEAFGASVVCLEATRKKALSKFLGTVSLNPNFLISSVIGIGPAILSGESGRFASWVPRTGGRGNMHIVTFANDVVSRPNTWKRLYDENSGIAIITLDGTHITLAHTETLRHIVDRIQKFGEEFAGSNGNLEYINWNQVHLKDSD